MQNLAEKQVMPSKTIINWLFNDKWCYLFIACFDWKIDLFLQTVALVYYLKELDVLSKYVKFL